MFNLDPTTVATLLAFIVSFVGVFKFLITDPDPDKQNNKVRLFSALVGTLVFVAWALTHVPLTDVVDGAKLAVDAAGQGFIAGSGAAGGVKGFHLVQAAASKVSVGNSPAPASPSPTTPAQS